MELLDTCRARLATADTLIDVIDIVKTSARALMGAAGATVVLREGNTCFYADEDSIAPLWKGQRFPLEACISGWAMLNARTAVIPDIYADDRIPHELYRPTFVVALAMVPIRPLVRWARSVPTGPGGGSPTVPTWPRWRRSPRRRPRQSTGSGSPGPRGRRTSP